MKRKPFLINKDFALLFIGRFVSDVGNYLYNFAIAWYVLTLTNSATQAGFYMAFGGIVFVILTPIAGVLVDRLDRIKIIYITDFIRGISIGLAGLAIGLQPTLHLGTIILDFSQPALQMVVLYVTAFIFSVNGALFNPAVTASIPYLVKDEELMKANSLNSGLQAFVSILGGLLAGVLYTTLGIGFILIITSTSYILSAISEIFIRTQSKEKNNHQFTLTQVLLELKEGFVFIIEKKGMLVFVVVVLLVNMVAAPLFAVGQPYFFNQVVQSEPWIYSLIGLAFSLGSMGMAIKLSKQPSPERIHKPLRKGLFGFVIGVAINGLVVQAFMQGWINITFLFGLMMLVSVGIGLCITYVNTPIGVALQRYIPKDKLGRVNAIINLLVIGIIPFSTALAGIAIEYFSLPIFYLLVTFGVGFATYVAYRSSSIQFF